MSETCEIVIVEGQDKQPLHINKVDYDADPTAYKLFKAPKTSKPAQTEAVVSATTAPASAKAPELMLVLKEGDLFFIVDVKSEKVVGVDGINAEGYASQDEAQAAIKTLTSGK